MNVDIDQPSVQSGAGLQEKITASLYLCFSKTYHLCKQSEKKSNVASYCL